VSGVPPDICKELLERAFESGIESRLLLVYSEDSSFGTFPLHSGHSARLGMGAITACRNTSPSVKYLMIVPSGGVKPEDTLNIDVASEIADILESVEEAFFIDASKDELFSVERHKKICRLALKGMPRPDFNGFRWQALRQVSVLLEKGWTFSQAYAATLGVPCDPNAMFAHEPSTDSLASLQRFSINKSRAESRTTLLAILDSNEQDVEFDIETVRAALVAFYRWAGESGSWSTADDWQTPQQLFKTKTVSKKEDLADELKWREVLNVPVIRWLLAGQVSDLKVRARLLDAMSVEIEPIGDSASNTYLIGAKFALSLVRDGEEGGGDLPSTWSIKPNGKKAIKLAEHLRHDLEIGAGDLNEGLFESEVACVGKHGDKSVKLNLLNLKCDKYGFRVFVSKGELALPVVQPREAAPGRITIKSSESIDLIVAFDKTKWSFSSAMFDGAALAYFEESFNHEMPDVAAVRLAAIDSDGQQQALSINLTKPDGSTTRLMLSVHSQSVTEGSFKSWLHYLAACHVVQRRLPFSLDEPAGHAVEKLAEATWKYQGDGRPVILEVGHSLESLAFDKASGAKASYGICGSPVLIARAYDDRIPDFSVPEQVSKARAAYIAVLITSGGAQGILAADLSSPKIKSALSDYLQAVDCWVQSEGDKALEYLEWMDTVHLYLQSSEGHGSAVGFFVLPSHPLVALGLGGMSDLLVPTKELRNPFRPPLARLFSSVGPRSWAIVKDRGRGQLIYDLRNTNDHYFRLYAARGASDDELSKLDRYVQKEFGVRAGNSDLSLSGKDVASVMDDICALNPALTEVNVRIASDRTGSIARGLLDWFRELEDAAAPEHAGWASSLPLSLAVHSSLGVVEENDIDGIIASLHDHPKNHLKWYIGERGRPRDHTRYDFSIFGELSSRPSMTIPGDRAFPCSVAFPSIGSSLSLTYQVDSRSREYAESCGEACPARNAGEGRFAETFSLHRLFERWLPYLVTAHRNICYGDNGIAHQLSNAAFVALPISGSSDMQAVAGVDPESAVWKFENAQFDIHQATAAGHVILTSKLDLIRSKLNEVLMSAGINITETEAKSLLLEMGRAGINTLHSVTDNEMVILGAVSSLAVMRSFPDLPLPCVNCDEMIGRFVLPLDSYGRVFQQLNKGGTRPDFLCFTLSRKDGVLGVQIDVLEAKWRTVTPCHQELLDMINVQIDPFVADLGAFFDTSIPGPTAVSASILTAELVASAIRLSESNLVTGGSPYGLEGARLISSLTAEMLSGNCRIHFAKHKIVTCVSGDRDAVAGFKCDADGNCVATMSVSNAVEIIRGTKGFSVNWGGARSTDPAAVPGSDDVSPVTKSPVMIPVSHDGPVGKDIAPPYVAPDQPVGPAVFVPPVIDSASGAEAKAKQWPPLTNKFGLIGQDNAVNRLVSKIAMQKLLNEKRFSDTMFVGPAGVGKSTFARSIAKELSLDCIFLSGTDVTGADAIIKVLLEKGKILSGRGAVMIHPCVIFIDEVHAISPKAANFLLNATDEKRVATLEGREYDFRSVIMLTATTDSGKLSTAFLSRFDDIPLPPYTPDELAGIVNLKGSQMISGLNLNREACLEIAYRLRLSPRRAILSLENQVMAHFIVSSGKTDSASLVEMVTRDTVAAFFDQQGIDRNGLTLRDVNCVKILAADSPVPRDRLSVRLKITNQHEYSELVEYLTRLGLITVDSKGVAITKLGKTYASAGSALPDLVRAN
jgi:Holliday junction resolvasome RuvABC ATP-dependent DNA helicase subunit